MELDFTHRGTKYRGMLRKEQYINDNLAVELLYWETDGGYWGPYAKLSVNTDLDLPTNEFVAKTYSENEGLVEQFIEAGYFEDTGRIKGMGYASGPILKITDKFLESVK